MLRHISGACSCRRNRYIVTFPQDVSSQADIFVDEPKHHYNAPAAPATSYLRVPLTWVQSTTYALYDDETHAMIRRSYTPAKQHYTKRHFCGFCSTPLSLWSEETKDDADYLCITIGTLNGDALDELEDMGLLSDSSDKGDSLERIDNLKSKPWYEKLVETGSTGNVKRKRGTEERDGRTVEWEIVEWTSDNGPQEETQEDGGKPLAKRPRSDEPTTTA